nr:EamA family transporter [Haliscomenobacter sp.]
MKGITRDQLLLAGAFAAVYLVWGSTYLVNYIAIQEIPPFLMSGMRFSLAGGLLLGLTLLQG